MNSTYYDIERCFNLLNEIWEHDTQFTSWIDTKHWAYRAIVGMGQDVAPVVLASTRKSPSWIVGVLGEIYPDADRGFPIDSYGQLDKLCEYWLGMAKELGIG